MLYTSALSLLTPQSWSQGLVITLNLQSLPLQIYYALEAAVMAPPQQASIPNNYS